MAVWGSFLDHFPRLLQAIDALFATSVATGALLGTSVFFGCHPTVMPRENERFSSDFPGAVRDCLCKGSDIKGGGAAGGIAGGASDGPIAMFFQAASGNICQCNPLNPDTNEVGPGHCDGMGETIAAAVRGMQDADSSNQNGRRGSPGRLLIASVTIDVPRRKIPDALLAWAKVRQQGTDVCSLVWGAFWIPSSTVPRRLHR